MSGMGQSGGLRIIFSIFLGLMVVAFVGVGVYTFHPPPHQAMFAQAGELDRREQAIRNARPPDELTAADRDQIQQLTDERHELRDAAVAAQGAWARVTSIILIVIATLAMAVSVVRSRELPVISNGLLLGGVFTMLYGVGWIVATDSSISRFVVMTVAFVITLGLGYVRFVRPETPDGPRTAPAETLADIERRVRVLEERIDSVPK